MVLQCLRMSFVQPLERDFSQVLTAPLDDGFNDRRAFLLLDYHFVWNQ